MAKVGGSNPLAFVVGGSPSGFEKTYQAIRGMMGDHGYATDEDEIEAEWRKAKAHGLALLGSFDERAVMQGFPHTATDLLPDYEEILGVDADPLAPDQVRRNEIVPLWTSTAEGWSDAVEDQLQAIDSRASLLVMPWESGHTTHAGKYYEAFSPISGEEYATYGTRRGTIFPNYSTEALAVVKFDIGAATAPSNSILRTIEQMREVLNRILPADVGMRFVHTTGFYLDSSLLDATGFGT